MKISFEKKIFLGFIINVLVVIASGWIFIARLNKQRDMTMDSLLNWIEVSLFILSIVLLVIVYFIIRSQLRAKKISRDLLFENKQLLQSIIDNTSNPIFIKKLNGEYLLINKQFGDLFKISNEEILGKTDHDFLPEKIADTYRNSDIEVVKKLRELKTEETIEQQDGKHTYIAVKFPLYDANERVYALGGILTDITERKKMEDSSKAANKFFNMSLDIMVIARNDKFVKINPSLSKTLGYSEEELINHPFLDYVFPDDRDNTQKEIDKLKTGISTIQFENRWVCKNKSVKWLLWSASPDLTTGLLYAVAHDVTEQKEIENSLIVADTFFNISYDIFVVAKDGYFLKINPAFTRTLGYNKNDLENKPFISLSHPDDKKTSLDNFKKSQKKNSVLSYRARTLCKDGSYKWLDWTSTFDVRTGAMYAAARDITKLVENEASLKTADQFFKMTFDILTVTKGDDFVQISPSFTKTLGYSQKDIAKIKYMELVHPDDKKAVAESLSALSKKNPATNFKNRILCKDGSYKWLDWNVNLDIKKDILYSAARDITENVRLEEEEKTIINNLYENEEKLRLIVENIGEGVIVANADKEIILANYRANEILGIYQNEKISTSLTNHFELYFPDERTIFPSQNLPMERAFNGEVTDDIDVILWDPEKREKKRVLISGRPLVDQDNNVVAAVITIKDISLYKKLEEELEETESKYRQLIGFRVEEEKKQEDATQNTDKKTL
ncbi:PAS domain S-box protein [Flavobacterium degerlachei]|jgi:PAS domain S-box-containing protein|uniref:histidine kinase n=1 Tax=Flavobacterium degerlachei TaxID=229203 RepID=A0A1H2TB88_9FLAO|nr:PAS domain S-box protein [Flavobacterium degerlachei]SDW41100.1 PAS domain S-box-containing protein [Flavobacterium degerlachei]